MIIENKRRVKSIKRIFFLVSVFIAVVALSLFLLDHTYAALACVGVFSIWYLYFHVADYQYIEFSDEDNKVLLRYYNAIRFGKGEYSSIEFPHSALQKADFENSVFGKLTDVTLIVKTKRGLAEFPSVSLTAMSKEERTVMKTTLYNIIHK